MKKISTILISSLFVVNLFAGLKDELKTENRDGIDFVSVDASTEGHIRDKRFFINFKDAGTLTVLFAVKDEKDTAYSVVTKYKSPMVLMKHQRVKKGEIPISIVPAAEVDLVLFRIYSQMNLDEVLQQIKSYPEDDFNAIFQMLYLISERVATISDKRKIMDFFMEHFNLKVPFNEVRKKTKEVFEKQWITFRIKRSSLSSCFVNYAIEYADYIGGMISVDDTKNVARYMLQNSIYATQSTLDSVESPSVFPEVKILYYIYSKSICGREQGHVVPAANVLELKEKLGKNHLGVRTLEIQDSILTGDLNPKFVEELREIVDQNYAIAFPIALDYARRTKAWEDVAYYAYLCLKHDVYGIQKQFLRNQNRSPYFDYLEFVLEGLSQTDAQAAGTLYEFIAALPITTKQQLWLFRADRILNGINYDKALAQKEGKSMAEQGFYENAKLEARFRESFEKRLKNNP